MLTSQITKEYRRLRAKGFTGADALRAARVNVAFEAAENAGLVEFRVDVDPEPYDASFVHTWGLPPARAQRAEREILERAERDGVWVISAVKVTDDEGEPLDSVGMFIGDDFADSGYDVDVKRSALEALGLWGAS